MLTAVQSSGGSGLRKSPSPQTPVAVWYRAIPIQRASAAGGGAAAAAMERAVSRAKGERQNGHTQL